MNQYDVIITVREAIMIYIGTNESNGSAIYFDIHSAERQAGGVRISGTIGDGSYEGEVLVEVGRIESVTFADAWLGGAGFSEFIGRCNVMAVEKALLETVRESPRVKARRRLPHGNAVSCSVETVMESVPVWQSRA
jgi:hypothetical protein